MKPTLLFTLSLLLFTFTITTYFSLSIAEPLSTYEEVKDSDGNHVFRAGRYYIMPSIFGAAGGGVRFDTTENLTCPVPLLQDYSEVVNGLPVHFYLQAITPAGMIYTQTPVNIRFDVKPECGWWFDWEVIRGEQQLGSIIGVGYGLDEGTHPIINGSFRIHRHGLGYKLEFCPVVGEPIGICYDVGRKETENGRHLVLTRGDPYEIVFVKADRDDSSM